MIPIEYPYNILPSSLLKIPHKPDMESQDGATKITLLFQGLVWASMFVCGRG